MGFQGFKQKGLSLADQTSHLEYKQKFTEADGLHVRVLRIEHLLERFEF